MRYGHKIIVITKKEATYLLLPKMKAFMLKDYIEHICDIQHNNIVGVYIILFVWDYQFFYKVFFVTRKEQRCITNLAFAEPFHDKFTVIRVILIDFQKIEP